MAMDVFQTILLEEFVNLFSKKRIRFLGLKKLLVHDRVNMNTGFSCIQKGSSDSFAMIKPAATRNNYALKADYHIRLGVQVKYGVFRRAVLLHIIIFNGLFVRFFNYKGPTLRIKQVTSLLK
jgi:hypothetical protein